MTKTEAVWQGFIKYGDEMTLEELRIHMKDYPGWSETQYYQVRKAVKAIREAFTVMVNPTIEQVKKHLHDANAKTFAKSYYDHMKNQSEDQKVAKVEMARRIFRDKGLETSTEKVAEMLREKGYEVSDFSTIRDAKRDVKDEQKMDKTTKLFTLPNAKEVVGTAVLADAPEEPNIDLATFRKFTNMAKQHGLPALLEIAEFVLRQGQDKLQYMTAVYNEAQPE